MDYYWPSPQTLILGSGPGGTRDHSFPSHNCESLFVVHLEHYLNRSLVPTATSIVCNILHHPRAIAVYSLFNASPEYMLS
jgi:hypothetical protein